MDMRIDNNNQTNFGMRKVVVLRGCGTKKFAKQIAGIKSEVMEKGYPQSTCFFSQVQGFWKLVRVRVVMDTDKGYFGGTVDGRVLYGKKRLLKLVDEAVSKMKEQLADAHLSTVTSFKEPNRLHERYQLGEF